MNFPQSTQNVSRLLQFARSVLTGNKGVPSVDEVEKFVRVVEGRPAFVSLYEMQRTGFVRTLVATESRENGQQAIQIERNLQTKIGSSRRVCSLSLVFTKCLSRQKECTEWNHALFCDERCVPRAKTHSQAEANVEEAVWNWDHHSTSKERLSSQVTRVESAGFKHSDDCLPDGRRHVRRLLQQRAAVARPQQGDERCPRPDCTPVSLKSTHVICLDLTDLFAFVATAEEVDFWCSLHRSGARLRRSGAEAACRARSCSSAVGASSRASSSLHVK